MIKRLFIIILTALAYHATAQESMDEIEIRRRAFIDDFLMEYQAAYEHKKIEYISNFFSTDALIITETKELDKCGTEIAPYTSKKRPYKLIVEDKKLYMERLSKLFNKNVKIKLGLSGIRVVKHPLYPEIFGISFLQIWLDQNEGNNLENQMPGYIFLMIDFKKSEITPIIHVRTWQPKDNVKSVKDKFNLMDFRIYDFK